MIGSRASPLGHLAPAGHGTKLRTFVAVTKTRPKLPFFVRKMTCEHCKRPLNEGEPVYRLSVDAWTGWGMACTSCKDKWEDRLPATCKTTWRPPQPCCRCSRPVYLYRAKRKGLRYFVCGTECRQAVHKANYRRTHPRPRVKNA